MRRKLRPAEKEMGRRSMRTISMASLAVAGIAWLCSGCGMTDYRAQWAQSRCNEVLAQARLEAVHDLLANGQTDQAQEVLSHYLPEAALPLGSAPMLTSAEEDGKEDNPSQYARLILESDLELQNQTW
jgi:hypothetical protein